MIEYSFYIISLLLNFLFFIFFKKIATIYNHYDLPGLIKNHKKKVPLLGGFFLAANFFVIFFCYLFLFESSGLVFDPIFFGSITKNLEKLLDTRSLKFAFVFFIIPYFFFFIGYLDDKFNINHNTKFFIFLSLIISSVLIDNNLIIREINFQFISRTIILNEFSIFFTIFSILVLINALNMFDGINLQCSLFYIFILSILVYFNSFTHIAIFFILNLIFFIFYNFKGKAFLGNSGNLFFTFLISILIIKSYNYKNFPNAEFVLLLLIIPGLDLIRLFMLRIINGKNPFVGDLNHIHHRLLKKLGVIHSNILISAIVVLPVVGYIYFHNFFISFFVSILMYFFLVIRFK